MVRQTELGFFLQDVAPTEYGFSDAAEGVVVYVELIALEPFEALDGAPK